MRDEDTIVCKEPLHLGHRVGAFRAPSRTLRPAAVAMATDFAEQGIVAVFGYFGLDVEDQFTPLRKTLDRALYDNSEADEES